MLVKEQSPSEPSFPKMRNKTSRGDNNAATTLYNTNGLDNDAFKEVKAHTLIETITKLQVGETPTNIIKKPKNKHGSSYHSYLKVQGIGRPVVNYTQHEQLNSAKWPQELPTSWTVFYHHMEAELNMKWQPTCVVEAD